MKTRTPKTTLSPALTAREKLALLKQAEDKLALALWRPTAQATTASATN